MVTIGNAVARVQTGELDGKFVAAAATARGETLWASSETSEAEALDKLSEFIGALRGAR